MLDTQPSAPEIVEPIGASLDKLRTLALRRALSESDINECGTCRPTTARECPSAPPSTRIAMTAPSSTNPNSITAINAFAAAGFPVTDLQPRVPGELVGGRSITRTAEPSKTRKALAGHVSPFSVQRPKDEAVRLLLAAFAGYGIGSAGYSSS